MSIISIALQFHNHNIQILCRHIRNNNRQGAQA